jgi:small conductance mechanosensitive channel
MKRFVLLFALLGIFAGSGLDAQATAAAVSYQQASSRLDSTLIGATAEVVGPQAATLFQQLHESVAASRKYRQRMAHASAEDSLVLVLQFEKSQDRFRELMLQVGELAPTAESSSELGVKLVHLYQDLVPYLFSRLQELDGDIDQLRAQRQGTPSTQRLPLEARITHFTRRLDLGYQYAHDHLAVLGGLGQDHARGQEAFRGMLRERADNLSGRLDLGVIRINELNRILKKQPGDADLGQLLVVAREDLNTNAVSMKAVLDIMEAEGLSEPDLRAQVLGVTQDLASGILDVRVTATLARKAWLAFSTWVRENGPGYLVRMLLVLAIMLVGWLVARLVRKAVEKSLERARLNISQLLKRTIVSFAHNVILALTVMVALSQFGISLGPLLAGFGVVGFILGFAMQDSLSNFAAGMMILFYRPYDVGDLVEISGVFGKVEHMSMVSTSVLTLDNQKLVVPNSKIWGDVIKNVTDQHVRRVDMVFGISYSDDIAKAEGVLNDILDKNDMVLDKPEPMVRLHTLNESSVDFVVRPWVRTADYWDVYWAVTREVKMRFDAESISIPFPQRDVHLYPTGKEGTAEA